jgi:hypothetical protein
MSLETPHGQNWLNLGGSTQRKVFIDHLVLWFGHKTVQQTHLMVKWCGCTGNALELKVLGWYITTDYFSFGSS